MKKTAFMVFIFFAGMGLWETLRALIHLSEQALLPGDVKWRIGLVIAIVVGLISHLTDKKKPDSKSNRCPE